MLSLSYCNYIWSVVSDSFLLSGCEQVMTNDSELIEVMLAGQGVLRLGENTTLTFEEIDNESKEYKLKLQGGTIWGNTQFDDFDLEIYTDTALVDPSASSFNVAYDGNKVEVYADTHDVYVGIQDKGRIINDFWLAQGNQVVLSDSKITEKAKTIEKLLYSKLVKEFNYGRLSAQKIKDDPWISSQRDMDSFYYKDIEIKTFTSIRHWKLIRLVLGLKHY